MRDTSINGIRVLIAMLLASVLAAVVRPTVRLAETGTPIDLGTMIPGEFGDWHLDKSVVPVLPSPDAQVVLRKIYSQTLSRTYANSAGDRVMLSVAYGSDQSDAMQVHKPEVCYPAQGFSVLKVLKGELATHFGSLPVTRLVAVQGLRTEPITYWITVGGKVSNSGLERKLEQLRYGLTGRIPDGMLVRVSSINRDEASAYRLQEAFLDEMLQAMTDEARRRVSGRDRLPSLDQNGST